MPRPRSSIAAVAIAIAASLAVVSPASAGSSGGAEVPGAGGGGGSKSCADVDLGERTLRRGDCGNDVETLNWILRAKDFRGVSLDGDFADATERAVRGFERAAGIAVDGVVERETTSALVRAMPSQLASWYGPGFFGNETACGQTLRRRTVGVAHKTLPCGSKVVIRYGGSYLRTRVIDRGPYAKRRKWDLTQAAARLLGFDGVEEVRVATIPKAVDPD